MSKLVSYKPLIRQGWLRVLLFCIAFGLAAGIGVFAYFIAQIKGKSEPGGWQSLMKGGNTIYVTVILSFLSLMIIYIFRRWIDRKTFISLGLDLSGHGREAIAGFMLSVFIISASSLLLKVTGHLKWMDIIFDSRALFLALGGTLMIAFFEELIFRGYMLNNLMDSFPKWLALLISALLFGIFHLSNPSSTGFFPFANSLIMGLILGVNYIYTRNLWFSFCFHAGWKFLEGPVFGYSGDEFFQTLLQPELKGDATITGGISGLEGSAILMATALLSLFALYLIVQKKLNLRFQPVPGRI